MKHGFGVSFLLTFLVLVFLIYSAAAAGQANLQIEGREEYWTDTNAIPQGIHLLQYGNSISTIVSDNSTVLGNISYTFGADNIDHVIYIQDQQYASFNSTHITWTYPSSRFVKMGSNLYSSFQTDFYSSQYIPMTLFRSMNQTQFSSSGYQLAVFNVSFENITYSTEGRPCTSIWTGIDAWENSNLNASLLLDTFSTDAPGTPYSTNNNHQFQFGWDLSNIQLNHEYTFSIVIRVIPKDSSTVTFKPAFTVVLFNETIRRGGSGSSASMPADMLPPHIFLAAASQNISTDWWYHLFYGRGAHFNQTREFGTTPYKIGTYQNGAWYLDTSGNGAWNAGDTIYSFGLPGWSPVTGDWNTTGKSSIGVTNGQQWFLDSNGDGSYDAGDRFTLFGLPGWTPAVGDWSQDGKTEIGVYKDGVWYLDTNGNTVFDVGDSVHLFGAPGWYPVVGDWNGDGTTDIGVANGQLWYLDMNNNGIWDAGDRVNNFGLAGWSPVVGDWNGDVKTELGVYKDGAWYMDTTGDGAFGSGDSVYTFGLPGWSPVSGKWS